MAIYSIREENEVQFNEINVCRIYSGKRPQIFYVIILMNLSKLIRLESNTHIWVIWVITRRIE